MWSSNVTIMIVVTSCGVVWAELLLMASPFRQSLQCFLLGYKYAKDSLVEEFKTEQVEEVREAGQILIARHLPS